MAALKLFGPIRGLILLTLARDLVGEGVAEGQDVTECDGDASDGLQSVMLVEQVGGADGVIKALVGGTTKRKQSPVREHKLLLHSGHVDAIAQGVEARDAQGNGGDRGDLVKIQRLVLVITDAILPVAIQQHYGMIEFGAQELVDLDADGFNRRRHRGQHTITML